MSNVIIITITSPLHRGLTGNDVTGDLYLLLARHEDENVSLGGSEVDLNSLLLRCSPHSPHRHYDCRGRPLGMYALVSGREREGEGWECV